MKLHVVDREVHQSCSQLPSSASTLPSSGFVLDINHGLFHKPANAFSKQARPLPMF